MALDNRSKDSSLEAEKLRVGLILLIFDRYSSRDLHRDCIKPVSKQFGQKGTNWAKKVLPVVQVIFWPPEGIKIAQKST